jgi:putative oxidoreductase
MEWVFLLGRILIAAVFLRFQFGGAGMSYAESYRAPVPRPLGLVVVIAALALAAGAWADVAALVLLAFLLVTTCLMHPFWKESDPQARMGQEVHFFKNLAVAGGLLVLFYAYYELGDGAGLSLTDPLLGQSASGD